MKTSSLRNRWNSIAKTLSRTNNRRFSSLSRRRKEATSQYTEVPKTPEPTACEANVSFSAKSDLTSDPREEDWPTDDSFVMEPDFSDPMSDNTSEKYQTKAVTRTTDDIKPTLLNGYGNYPMRSHLLAQITSERGPTLTEPMRRKYMMSCSNTTGQFTAPSTASEGTAHTAEVFQQMSYIGGMNYARARLQKATAPRPPGKGKHIRPPALLAQTGTTGPHGDSRSSSPSSKAASARSSAYRAVHEAAKARKALLDAQIGVKQAASQLSERKGRCDREHQAIVEGIEAVQSELRTSTERQTQGQEIQAARMDAMGYRMAEMKDLMAQREVRMEAQIQEVCSQIQAMGTMLKNIQYRPTSSTIKDLLQDTEMSLPRPMKNVSIKLPVMKRFRESVHAKSPKIDKVWAIIDHLEGEARNYIINKSEPERDEPDKVFTLLASRFGTGGNRMHVRQTFMSRTQQEREDWMQFLDALEGLRTQGFPDEPITTRRYEILQRFKDGVSDPTLRQDLAVVYAAESYLTEPPIVESLRFTTRQLQRHRPTTSKPYDPRYAMRSRPHLFVPGKMVPPAPGLPQNVLPPNQGQREAQPQLAAPSPASVKQAPLSQHSARVVPQGACFNCGLMGHFARECPNRDQARKPVARAAPDDRVNMCENNVASACSGPVFCVNCGMTEHSASQCQNIPVHEDLAYSLWAEQPSAPPQTLSDNKMVLMLRPAEAAHVATPLIVACGKIQIQTNPEPITFDPSGRTIMSVRLLLAIERETRPELTIDALIDEIIANENYQQMTLPQPEEWQVKGVTSTYHAYSPIPVKVCIDCVDMRFGATIITDAFPPGICLGPKELQHRHSRTIR